MGRGRPRMHSDMLLSTDNVFARMLPGKTYRADVIAAKFKVQTAEIRPFLDHLVGAGRIEYSHAKPKVLGFRRPGEAPKPVEPAPVYETSIAGPAIPPDLTSTLTGYEAALRRQFELSKLSRTR